MARRRARAGTGEIVSKTIDSLIEGVSQQPPSIRLASQCEAQDNMISKIVEGVRRRPPTEFIAALDEDPYTAPTEGYKAHIRARDESIQHLVLIENGAIRAFNLLTGQEAEILSFPMTAVYTETVGEFNDRTDAANQATINDVTLIVSEDTNSGSWFCGPSPFGEIEFKISTPGEGNYTMAWEYSTGQDSWETLTVTDGTGHFKNGGSTSVTFTPPADWAETTEDTVVGYWVRARYVSGTITQDAYGDQMWIRYDSYLDIAGDSANEAFSITSVADYSFIVNKETEVAMSGVATAARTNEFMIFFVETGGGGSRDWNHIIGDAPETPPITLANSNPVGTDPGDMIQRLLYHVYDEDNNYPRWIFNREHMTVLHGIQDTDVGNPDEIGTPTYDYSDEVYTFIGPQTQRFSDLPPKGVDGFLTEVTGADGNEENNYWIVYDESLSAWVETVGPTLDNTFNKNTMPHVLIQTSVGGGTAGADTFTFGPQTWAERAKGDVDSAPEPTFVGNKISDVFFHKNRLGFAANESIILSEAGEFFNFWPTTVTTIVESDPIDAAGTNNRIALIDHAIPYDQQLYLFSGLGGVQNVLQSAEKGGLSSANAEIVEASAFSSSPLVKPVAIGKAIYFVVDRGVSSSLMEYTITDKIPDAMDVAAHAPSYVPGNVQQMSGSQKESVLTLLSTDTPNVLYVYSFFFLNGERRQSAWCKWEFDDSYDILAAEWVGEKLYLVIDRGDDLILEFMNLATLVDGDLNHRVFLDAQEELTGSYTEADGLTTWTTEQDMDPDKFGEYRAVMTASAHGDNLGVVVPLTYVNATTVTAEGDWEAGAALLGRAYSHNYEFTSPYITVPNATGSNDVAVLEGRTQIMRFTVMVRDSAGFEARVTSTEVNPEEVLLAEEEYVYNYPGKLLNAGTVDVVNPKPVDSFTFDVGVENKFAKIRITGSSHLPCVIASAEWEGMFTTRSSRT